MHDFQKNLRTCEIKRGGFPNGRCKNIFPADHSKHTEIFTDTNWEPKNRKYQFEQNLIPLWRQFLEFYKRSWIEATKVIISDNF